MTFKDKETQADWVARKKTLTIDVGGNFINTQNVDMMLDELIIKLGELEVVDRLSQVTPLGLDMLLEFNNYDFIDTERFERLGFITSSIYRTMQSLVDLEFVVRVAGLQEYSHDSFGSQQYEWGLNRNGKI